MLEIKNISKSYDRLVLNDVSFSLGDNGLIYILGESGSGKSTLLNIIAGIEKPDCGIVKFNNDDIFSIDRSIYNNKIISYIFQNYNLIDKYSVKDNILLPIMVRKEKNKYDLSDIMGALKIKYLLGRKVNKLSGGERQRIAIARGLIQDSKIILADEPTGALDSSNSLRIMSILKRISKDKLVIVVTHNKRLAEKFADKIIFIKDGDVSFDNLNKCNEVVKKKTFINNNIGLKFKDMFKFSLINLWSKKIRNLLTIIAFMIGLFSLGLVFAISNGFNRELNSLNQSSLFNYPLVISKLNYVDSYNDNIVEKDGIKVKNGSLVKNDFDNVFFDKIKFIDNNLINGISYVRDIDNDFKNISFVMPNIELFDLVEGRMSSSVNEVVLLLDSDNSISEDVYDYLNVEKNGVINNSFVVDEKELVIVGVVKSNNDYFSDLSGILYSNDLFDDDISDIYIYAKSLDSKDSIKNILSDYYIRDDAKDVVDVLSSLIDSVSVVLIIFSMISLLVSSIMIWVISYISVIERMRDIGIYKCVGFRNKDIRNLFVMENLIIGFCSWLFAVIFILLISSLINSYVFKMFNISKLIFLNFKSIILLLVISLFLCCVSSLIPAIIGSKKKIVDIINS